MANYLISDYNNPSDPGTVRINFHVLQFPQYLSTKVNYTSRTGVDGFAVWRAGYRGEAFQIVTVADFDSFQKAHDEYQQAYLKARGKRFALVYEDQDTNTYLDVVVLDVQPAGAGRTRGAYKTLKTVGGLVGETEDGGIIRARWTLLGIQEQTQ